MTSKEVELMVMLVKLHRKINQLHEEKVEPSTEFLVDYVASKLTFKLEDEDKQQVLNNLGR